MAAASAIGRAFSSHSREDFEEDVVERFDHGPADPLGDPGALRLTILDRSDATVVRAVAPT
jgi:hypothetical protein